jgi:hypothetical protein
MEISRPPSDPNKLFGLVPTKKKIQDALLVFAKEGNIEGVQRALQMLHETGSLGKAVNRPHQQGGYTPLHAAAGRGNTEIVKLLVANGANVLQETDFGKSALDLAQLRGFSETADVLRPVTRLAFLKAEQSRRTNPEAAANAAAEDQVSRLERLKAEKDKRDRQKQALEDDGMAEEQKDPSIFNCADSQPAKQPPAPPQESEWGESQRMGLLASFHLLMLQGFEAKRFIGNDPPTMWVLYTDLSYLTLFVAQFKGDQNAERYIAKDIISVRPHESDGPKFVVEHKSNTMVFEVDDVSARNILVDMFRLWAEKGYCKWNKMTVLME